MRLQLSKLLYFAKFNSSIFIAILAITAGTQPTHALLCKDILKTSIEKKQRPANPEIESLRETALKTENVNPLENTEFSLIDVLKLKDLLSTKAGRVSYSQIIAEISNLSAKKRVAGIKLIEKLGSGFNGEVYLGGDNYVYKFPSSEKGIVSLQVEASVAYFLKKNFETYNISVLNNLKIDSKYRYIKKKLVEKKYLATEILKNGGLSHEQEDALELLFYKSIIFAKKTGIGLDLKSENIFWNEKNKEWALLEAGPRTSYLPYGFTLDVTDFNEYLKIWNKSDPPFNIEKTYNRNFFEKFEDINKQIYSIQNLRDLSGAAAAEKAVAEMMSDTSVPSIVKYHVVSDMTSIAKIRSFIQRVESQNYVDVESYLNEGIRLSDLEGNELKKALYRVTRLSQVRDYYKFASLFKKFIDNADVWILDSDQEIKHAYYILNKTRDDLVMVKTERMLSDLEAYISNPKLNQKKSLLLSSEYASKLIKNRRFIEAVKKAKLKILITDQFSSNVSFYNFNNPERIAHLLKLSLTDRVLDIKDEMQKLGIGEHVRAIFYDPDIGSKGSIFSINKRPKKSITFEQAIEKIKSPKMHESKILRFKSNTLKNSLLLNFVLANVYFESLNKTNLRIGRMLKEAASYADKNGLDENFYFYIGDASKSPIMIKKILQESYSISEDRFFYNKSEVVKTVNFQGKRPMVLVIDDFIGSGNSMRSFVLEAKINTTFEDKKHNKVEASYHPFAPFVTQHAVNKYINDYVGFTDQLVHNTKNDYVYKAITNNNKAEQFDINNGFGSTNTAIAFEYMAPDNNVGINSILEAWTLPDAIKTW